MDIADKKYLDHVESFVAADTRAQTKLRILLLAHGLFAQAFPATRPTARDAYAFAASVLVPTEASRVFAACVSCDA